MNVIWIFIIIFTPYQSNFEQKFLPNGSELEWNWLIILRWLVEFIVELQVVMEMYLAASPPLFSYLSMDPMTSSSPPMTSSQQASSNAYRRRPTSFYRSSSTSINQLAVGINNIDFSSFSLPPPLQLPVSLFRLNPGCGIGANRLRYFGTQLQRSSSVRVQLPIRSASVPDISVFARRNLSLSSAHNASSTDLTRRNGLSVARLASTSDLTGNSVIDFPFIYLFF